MLFLTSWNIDAKRASEKARKGILVKVDRGVYVQPGDDIDEVILQHAVRVAKHVCPGGELLGPHVVVSGHIGGHVYLASGSKVLKKVGPLTVHSFRARQGMPSPDFLTIADPGGEIRVECAGPGKALVDAISLHQQDILDCDPGLWALLLQNASKAIHADNDREKIEAQIDQVTKALRCEQVASQIKGEVSAFHSGRTLFGKTVDEKDTPDSVDPTLGRFNVSWFGRPVGHINIGERNSELVYNKGWLLPLGHGRHDMDDALPPFVDSILPDRTDSKLCLAHDIHRIGEHGRFVSNIDIHRGSPAQPKEVDKLSGSIEDFSDEETQIFTGTQNLVALSKISASGISRELSKGPYARLSGVQVKVPCHLSDDGVLSVADDRPFTHILKLPGQNQFSALGLVEWAGMSMARTAALDVAKFAGVQVDGQGFCFLVERFDIPGPHPEDHRLLMQEDILSLMSEPSVGALKYGASIEHAGIVLDQVATDPVITKIKLFHMAFAAAVTGNPDMHLKNISVLKTAKPTLDGWSSIDMSPTYDFVAAAGIPMMNTSQALQVNGKKSELTAADFLDLAYTLGVDGKTAAVAMGQTSSRIYQWCSSYGQAMVKFAEKHHPDEAMVLKISIETAKRSALMFHSQALESGENYASLFDSVDEKAKSETEVSAPCP